MLLKNRPYRKKHVVLCMLRGGKSDSCDLPNLKIAELCFGCLEESMNKILKLSLVPSVLIRKGEESDSNSLE